MSQVAIQKVNDTAKTSLPIFEEVARRFDAVRQRAFDLFENRGGELGHDQEDWLKAERELFCWPAAELAERDGKYESKANPKSFHFFSLALSDMCSHHDVSSMACHRLPLEVEWSDDQEKNGVSFSSRSGPIQWVRCS